MGTYRAQSFPDDDATRRYVELESWQIEEIQQAVIEADAGDFACDVEFDEAMKKHAS